MAAVSDTERSCRAGILVLASCFIAIIPLPAGCLPVVCACIGVMSWWLLSPSHEASIELASKSAGKTCEVKAFHAEEFLDAKQQVEKPFKEPGFDGHRRSEALVPDAAKATPSCFACFPIFGGCCVSRPAAFGKSGSRTEARRPHVRQKMPAKFCGWRCSTPSGELPSCDAFLADPFGGPLPGEWIEQLCSKEEIEMCEQLRKVVAATPGMKDDITMLRFLRARKRDVEAAANQYNNAMRFRQDPQQGLELAFRQCKIPDEAEALHQELDMYWKPVGLLGFDREGDPVLWERLGIMHAASVAQLSLDFALDHEVRMCTRVHQAMEEAMRLQSRPLMRVTVVEDLQGLGLHHLNRGALKIFEASGKIGGDNFPEFMKRCIVVRAPSIFAHIWSVASKFLDEGTRDKVQIMSTKNTEAVLKRFIDPQWIPAALGGSLRINGSDWCEPIFPMDHGPIPDDLLARIRAYDAKRGPVVGEFVLAR